MIVAVNEMLASVSLEQFSTDNMRRMATKRYLEVVCEAARRLPDEIKRRTPDIDWRKMNDFANLLHHAYQSTKVDIVGDIVQNHLPPLKSYVELQMRDLGK